jgi:hypothetical protein
MRTWRFISTIKNILYPTIILPSLIEIGQPVLEKTFFQNMVFRIVTPPDPWGP